MCCYNQNYEGVYKAIGETVYLNSDSSLTKIIKERIYNIKDIGNDQYYVTMTDITSNFILNFLFYKNNNTLVSSTQGGVDNIFFDDDQLKACYSLTDNKNISQNGNYSLTRYVPI
jgi:hypothetical protein